MQSRIFLKPGASIATEQPNAAVTITITDKSIQDL
jgi:hypothetical protein